MSTLTAYDKFIQQALKYGFSLFGLAKTGQTISYDTGDDGELEKGYPASGVRFVDNGDGTITDNATGLMWVKDPAANPGAPFDAATTWANALINCNALNFAGHTDWRLPNIKEMMSIVDYGANNPSINAVFFPNTKHAGPGVHYWSSTTRDSVTADAWWVDFDEGVADVGAKSGSDYARPVRLGVPKE